MLTWMKKRPSTAPSEPAPDIDAAEGRRSAMSGKYRALYKYLNGRYANVRTTTFAYRPFRYLYSARYLPDMAERRPSAASMSGAGSLGAVDGRFFIHVSMRSSCCPYHERARVPRRSRVPLTFVAG